MTATMTAELDDRTAPRCPRREHEVLALMAAGRSNVAIADELTVTAGAVEKHVANIFDKLGLRPSPDANRRVLAVLAYLGARRARRRAGGQPRRAGRTASPPPSVRNRSRSHPQSTTRSWKTSSLTTA